MTLLDGCSFVCNRVLLCSPGWLWTGNPPASDSLALKFPVFAMTPKLEINFKLYMDWSKNWVALAPPPSHYPSGCQSLNTLVWNVGGGKNFRVQIFQFNFLLISCEFHIMYPNSTHLSISLYPPFTLETSKRLATKRKMVSLWKL